jgi:hypothetical protein
MATSQALGAELCEPQLQKPVEDWDPRLPAWNSQVLITDFAVSNARNLCPTRGLVGANGPTVFVKKPDETIWFWFRIQGNNSFFKDSRTGVLDASKLRQLPVKFVLSYADSGEPHDGQYTRFIEGQSIFDEMNENSRRLENEQGRPLMRDYFDYRLTFNSTEVLPKKIRIQLFFGEKVAECRHNSIRVCTCPSGDSSCVLVLDLKEE